MSEITTVAGRSVDLRPVSGQMLNEIQVSTRRKAIANGAKLNPPTYKTKTVSGDEEEFPHDETTLETDEDRAAWEEYQKATQDLEVEIVSVTNSYIISEGVVIGDIPDDWFEKREWLGLDVPEKRLDQRLLYIETEVLTTPEDVIRAISGIMHLTARGSREMEERLADLDDLFRRALEGPTA
jgi:hypothetical protein